MGVRGVLTLCLLLAAAAPAAAESLGDVLREQRVAPGPGMKSDTPITGHSVLADATQFVVAYYNRDDGPAGQDLGDPPDVVLADHAGTDDPNPHRHRRSSSVPYGQPMPRPRR